MRTFVDWVEEKIGRKPFGWTLIGISVALLLFAINRLDIMQSDVQIREVRQRVLPCSDYGPHSVECRASALTVIQACSKDDECRREIIRIKRGR